MTDIVDGIQANLKPRHDTLYCNGRHKSQIVGSISGGGSGLRADNLQILGLEVITHKRFDVPITCERGEIFDLTEDYKCGEAEPVEI